MVKAVAANYYILGVFYQEVSVESIVDRVSRDGDASDCNEVDVVFLRADQISRDGEQAYLVVRLGRVAYHQYIRASWRGFCLDGIARYGAFANGGGSVAGVDPDICRSVRFFIVVVFDVVAGDLQVADLRSDDFDASAFAIADVRGGNDDLVKIYMIEKDAYAAVVVQMTVGDKDVSGAVVYADGVV